MIFVLLLNLIAIYQVSGVIVLQPTGQGSLEAGFVLVQGSQIDSANYRAFGQALQSKFPGKLWVAIAEFPRSTPEPAQIAKQVSSAIESIQKAGCNVTKDTPFFFAGHALGGFVLYNHLLDNATRANLPVKVAGVILEAAYVERKNRDKVMSDPTLPSILSIGGELDGVNRVTRMAEAFYFDSLNQRAAKMEIMTLIVKGMNHYQFVGEGQPPSLVKENDIAAEITDLEARDQVTTILASYMKLRMEASNLDDLVLIQGQLNYTSTLLNPIIEAFKLEGNYHMFTPCYKAKQGQPCLSGSPWTQTALQIMAANVSIVTTNEFRPVQNLPAHHPHIFNNCSVPYGCTLNASTITDNMYDSASEKYDSALQPIAAYEMRTKLSSRQNIFLQATGVTYDFDETDGKLSTCSVINQAAVDWALQHSPSLQVQRYNSKGKQMVMGADAGPYNIFPLWMYYSLSYKDKTDATTNKRYTEVGSCSLKTPVKYWMGAAAAFHFCKILSPARAMEWIYVDSLKP